MTAINADALLPGTLSPAQRRTLAYGAALWCDARARGLDEVTPTDAVRALNLDATLTVDAHAEVIAQLVRGLDDHPLIGAPPEVWIADLEAQLASEAPSRRSAGAFYTPARLADGLVDLAWPEGIAASDLRICDPACGAGSFLLAAHARLTARLAPAPDASLRAASALYGVDLDASAAALARGLVWRSTGAGWARLDQLTGIIHGDALLGATPTLPAASPLGVSWREHAAEVFDRPQGGFDLVIGNPPFLNQLQRSTTRGRAAQAHLRARFPGCLGAYTDAALVFTLLASELCRPGGRAAMILPLSSLSTRDGQAIRDALLHQAQLEHLWFSLAPLFEGTNVRVCAPVLRRGAVQPPTVHRSQGASLRPLPDAPAPRATEGWTPLIADAAGIPACRPRTGRCVGEVAEVGADFRDQYYGLREALVDLPTSDHPMLITTGLVDPAHCRWGEASTKLLGRTLAHPRVALARLDPAMQRWARSLLTPKLLLATQTRVLECVADAEGAWLPSVPLIRVIPKDPQTLWHLAAALSSPTLSALAAERSIGGALSTTAIKLSAAEVRELPLPPPSPAWDAAASAIRAAHERPQRRPEHLLRCAAHMQQAYGSEDEVLHWWRTRLPRR